MKALN